MITDLLFYNPRFFIRHKETLVGTKAIPEVGPPDDIDGLSAFMKACGHREPG